MTEWKEGKRKTFAYEDLAYDFDSVMNKYDLTKRLRIIFNHMLNEKLKDKLVLDAGCGTGWFSRLASLLGAKVVSLDVGHRLLSITAERADTSTIQGDLQCLPFQDEVFDLIICSEVIEHVRFPKKALAELYRILKNRGFLLLTTPNRVWYFALLIANIFRLRPYKGLENWLWIRDLGDRLEELDFKIDKIIGFNIIPFFSPKLYNLINYFDRFPGLYHIMLNVGIRAKKRSRYV